MYHEPKFRNLNNINLHLESFLYEGKIKQKEKGN